MNDIAFCSVALTHAIWGPAYLRQLDRLKKSILKIYPNANLFFRWDTLPPGAKPFLDSLYGQKPHSIQEAVDAGFKKVIWLDPAMILVDKIDDLLKYEVIAVKDENLIYNVISDKCCKYFGVTNQKLKNMGWRLVGGSLYYFDFNIPRAVRVFNMWIEAEKAGIFGSQQEQSSEQLQGHRSDETVMAIVMYKHDIEPQDGIDVRYCSQENPMMIKKHFK